MSSVAPVSAVAESLPRLTASRVPTATYRLQFSTEFRLFEARGIVDYLHRLGIGAAYCSPLFRAREGSAHGYDVIDHTSIHPEFGTEADFRELAEQLGRRAMGLILDIVPNHMGIVDPNNNWWQDVLENGPSSPHARAFDIDWDPPKQDFEHKVILPFLGDQYGRVLENQEIRLVHDENGFHIRYYEFRFPLAPRTWRLVLTVALDLVVSELEPDNPDRAELESIITSLGHLPRRTVTNPTRVEERSREKAVARRRLAALVQNSPLVARAIEQAVEKFNGIPGDPSSFDFLEELLADQAYRLCYWRVAMDEINYRRFFDINELAAVRVEEPDVFQAAHALALRMIGQGLVTGLRVDHVDGLLDPEMYLQDLQLACQEAILDGGLKPNGQASQHQQPNEHQVPSEHQTTSQASSEGVSSPVSAISNADEVRQDELRQDELRQDELRQDELRQDQFRQDELQQDQLAEKASLNNRSTAEASAGSQRGVAQGPLSDCPTPLRQNGQTGTSPETEPVPGMYVLVEKILARDELLPSSWAVCGTTGYEFMNDVTGVLVERGNALEIQNIYQRFTGINKRFHDVIYESKKEILRTSMTSELHVLSRRLDRISEQHRYSRDFTFSSLRTAIQEVIACFPVYRTYTRPATGCVEEDDRHYVNFAVAAAKRRNPSLSATIFDFVASVLLMDDPPGLDEDQLAERHDFIQSFQQLTGPAMAKGLEDTAFYRLYPLASLNEVGGHPWHFGLTVDRFHQENQQRLSRWPHSMLATSTHDTKRGEDTRARINVLSEIPSRWEEALASWHEMNARHLGDLDIGDVPDANEEYLYYQVLVGSWPLEPISQLEEHEYQLYVDRILQYMEKALKEAKLNNSWLNQNAEHDAAMAYFVSQTLKRAEDNPFPKAIDSFVRPLIDAGLCNALSQVLLKIGSPGVPDFYQGTEIWQFTLVDPDNRRPVDYEARLAVLDELELRLEDSRLAETLEEGLAARRRLIEELLRHRRDGRIKQFLTYRGLRLRQELSQLFLDGDYLPLRAEGPGAEHVIAFARRYQDQWALCVTPRCPLGLPTGERLPLGEEAWQDTLLRLPASAPVHWQDALLEGAELTAQSAEPAGLANAEQLGPTLPLATLLSLLPVALLRG